MVVTKTKGNMIAALVEIQISREDKLRMHGLIEICDDQSIVRPALLAKGFPLALEPGEFRFYPYGDGDWLCLACVSGDTAPAILRLPKSTGDTGKEFLLGYVGSVCKQEGGGVLRVGLQKTDGSNN